MFDTHCHLTDARLAGQLEAVLARAAAAGVSRMVTIGTDVADAEAAIAVCRDRSDVVRCAIGVHPNHVEAAGPDDLASLRAMAADASVVALGEMGLEYHYDTRRDLQRTLFVQQLALAVELCKPVVIHSRESVDDTLAILADFPSVRAVFHCFTGTVAEVERVLAGGYLVGFTGPITFRKNDELRRAVAAVPIDRLLLETDAPYLSPEPVRKVKTCEPAFVVHTARVAAEVKGVTFDEIDVIMARNAQAFYNWP